MPAATKSHANAFSNRALVCAMCHVPGRSSSELTPAGRIGGLSDTFNMALTRSVRFGPGALRPRRCTETFFGHLWLCKLLRLDRRRDQRGQRREQSLCLFVLRLNPQTNFDFLNRVIFAAQALQLACEGHTPFDVSIV